MVCQDSFNLHGPILHVFFMCLVTFVFFVVVVVTYPALHYFPCHEGKLLHLTFTRQ